MYSPYGSYIEHFANTQNNNYMICNLQSCIPVKDVISLCDKEKCIDFNINNIFTETLYNLNIQGPPQNTQGPTPPYMQGPPQNTLGPTPPYMQGPPQNTQPYIQGPPQNTQGPTPPYMQEPSQNTQPYTQGPPQNTQGPTPPYMQGPPQNTQGPTPPYMQGPPQIIQDLQQNTQGLVSYVQRKAPSIFDLQRNTHM